MGVAGIPWFTTDIGGFGGGRVDDPAFHELLVRWFQMGTFMPVMRLHGDRGPSHEVLAADGSRRCNSGADNELWSYGDEVYGILSRYVHLREEMREYTRGMMEAAHTDGQPVMRGLFHDFPEDAAAWDVADQFLYGPSLLVAPVLEAGARTRRVYLPAGPCVPRAAGAAVPDGDLHVGDAAHEDRRPSREVGAADGWRGETLGRATSCDHTDARSTGSCRGMDVASKLVVPSRSSVLQPSSLEAGALWVRMLSEAKQRIRHSEARPGTRASV